MTEQVITLPPAEDGEDVFTLTQRQLDALITGSMQVYAAHYAQIYAQAGADAAVARYQRALDAHVAANEDLSLAVNELVGSRTAAEAELAEAKAVRVVEILRDVDGRIVAGINRPASTDSDPTLPVALDGAPLTLHAARAGR